MADGNGESVAGILYAEAYEAHYTAKDLVEALRLYRGILAAHPDSEQAGYAHSQIQNIANSVVPRQELVDAQADLAQAHLGARHWPAARTAPATAPASIPER